MHLFWLLVLSLSALLCAAIESTTPTQVSAFKVIVSLSTDKSVGVITQGSDQIHLLRPSGLDPLLHIGNAPSGVPYHYAIVNNESILIDQEPFDRPPSSASLHEFYGRSTTILPHNKHLPLPSFGNAWERLDNSVLHPTLEIPTMHIKAHPDDIRELYEHYLEDFSISANISHISAENFRHFENVKFELGGQTSRLFQKLSFNVHLAKDADVTFGGYRRFKLRSCATDPTFMREKLYYDALAAAGLPASSSSYVRLFVNGEPLGLYGVIDNYKNPFLKNVFGKGRKYKHGVLYQGSLSENPMAEGNLKSGANLEYHGELASDYRANNVSIYKIQAESSKHPTGMDALIEFMAFIKDAANDQLEEENVVEAWESRLDVTMFLTNMAFEVLMGQADGYLGLAHNYFLYQEPKTGRFLWMSADLDQTLGSALVPMRNVTERNSEFAAMDLFDLLNSKRNRPLMQQILRVPAFKSRFIEILSHIYKSLYADGHLYRRTEFLSELIKEDVLWDQSLQKIRLQSQDATADRRRQIQEKILQLPLGRDFLNRIGNIDFQTALDGPLDDHPSLVPLRGWINQISDSLYTFLAAQKTNVQIE